MSKDIIFQDCPIWIQKYCIKLHKVLIPEWTLLIRKTKEQLDPKDPDLHATVEPSFNYMDAEIVLGRGIVNDVHSRRLIAHEMLHLLLYGFTNNPNEDTEEQVVVKLAKIIESLV